MNFDFDHVGRQDAKKGRLFRLGLWMVELVAVIILAFVIVHFGLQKIKIHGDSMSPTLVENDSIIVNRLNYKFSAPKRGDVIVFKQSGQEHSYYNVKRIIALPGETIEIKDGLIYINGKEYKEQIEVEAITNSGIAQTPYKLEDTEYFVLGDNRKQSIDSRFQSFGTVVEKDIIGKAWIRTNPFKFVSSLNIKPKAKETEAPAATPSASPSPSPKN